MIRTRLLSSAAAALLATVTAAGAQTNTREPQGDAVQSTPQRSPSTGTTPRSGTQQMAPSTGGQSSDGTTMQERSSSRSAPMRQQRSRTSGQGVTQERGTTSRSQDIPSATRTLPNAGARDAQSPAQRQRTQGMQQQPSGERGQAQLSEQQQTRLTSAISRSNVRPVTNVDFAVSVGTTVPRRVRVHTLPPDIVSIVPQYRGYRFFRTSDEIVIVEPRSYRVVSVLPYGSALGQATTTTRTSSRTRLSPEQRQVIRRQVTSQPVVTRSTVTIGEAVPDDVELLAFPTTVYSEVPTVREYRYYRTDRNVVVVDPSDRHVIDVID